jgi:hypothetical protein
MSIRFAPAIRPCAPRMARGQVRALARTAANDNSLRQIRAAALHAALRHFARHGLSAARVAGEQAQAALAAGDADGHSRWLDICRTLDRHTAACVTGLTANRR